MTTSASHVIGIDLGATNVKLVVVTRAGDVLRQEQLPTGEDFRATVKDALRRATGACDSEPLLAIASPGIPSPDRRSIWWMKGRLADTAGFDWTTFLGSDTAIPVLNDAQAALLGEIWKGAARGATNAILLTLGTGVGGAAMVDGRLLRGHLGRAGHLGHISLHPRGPLDIVNTPGSLEDAVGDCTVALRTNGQFTTTSALVAAAAAGDDGARRAWADAVRALAAGIVSLVNVLDPEIVILGGGIARAPALLEQLCAELDELEWRPHGRAVKLVAAQAGEFAGALGAAWYAMNRECA